jgi:hypothetical protein
MDSIIGNFNAAEILILSYSQQSACLEITVNVLRARSGMLYEEIPRKRLSMRNPNPSDDGAQNTGVPSLRMKAVNKAKMM